MTRIPDLMLINKKKRTPHVGDFFVKAANRVKIKESKKLDTYLDLIKQLKIRGNEGDGCINHNRFAWNGL